MPTVLITGAARGIGRTTALQLAAAGWEVIAGVRDPAAGAELEAAGSGRIRAIELDVTDAAHVERLAELVPGPLDALVNNAGIVVGGPVEGLSAESLRHQFDVNVFGQVAVTRAPLPRLRERRGRVVFVSSLSGRISTPMTGAYNESKFALEALADALRLELRPWGVRVSLIEPAQTDTDLWRDATAVFDRSAEELSAEHRELYAAHLKGYRRTIPASQRLATSASGVADAIERALGARRPRARYVVGVGPKVQATFMHFTPTLVADQVLSRLTGVPRKPGS